MKLRETVASELQLSTTSRKALTVHLSDAAGREVAELLQKMAERIERLERTKVDVMPVVSPATRNAAKSRRSA